MSLRKEFVLRALSGSEPIAALCREFGISRKTGYKWIERFKKRGLGALVDESRRPSSSPLQTSADVALEILRIRQEHRTWGPKKIFAILERSLPDGQRPPSVRTIARVLDRAGMQRKRRYRRATGGGRPGRAPSFPVEGANDVWTIDFKGWWRTKDGTRCEPLTVRDAYSRFLLAVRILSRTRVREVRPVFEELFERHGLPRAIQSDNGQPWASTQTPAGLTRLSAWWVSLGIELVRSHSPQDNGGHERMHADISIEIQEQAAPTIEAQQAVCDAWVHEFNHVRPHEALGFRTPAELYRPSPRRPGRIVVGGYPEECEIVRVKNEGRIHYDGRDVYLTTAIRNHHVGVQWNHDRAIVWFYHLPLGTFGRAWTSAWNPSTSKAVTMAFRRSWTPTCNPMPECGGCAGVG